MDLRSHDETQSVLNFQTEEETAPAAKQTKTRVPARFFRDAQFVAAHASPDRWNLLYRIAWRLTHGEPALLDIAHDADTNAFTRMQHSVQRDIHKMHAFVRFHAVRATPESDESFVAWYAPEHHIVRLATPFFAKRFANMQFTIMTADETAMWDGAELKFVPGTKQAPTATQQGDAVQALWKTYYASIFNPARLNMRMMRQEMPQRYWATMPETTLINQLARRAPERVQAFHKQRVADAADLVPPDASNSPSERFASLQQAAGACRVCTWCAGDAPTVFGEGPLATEVVIVGEQPGDQEDVAQRPFVGPAGTLLMQALDKLGVARESVYLTNSVKHFKYQLSGKRRIHQRPRPQDVAACNPWLRAELTLLRPRILICLGTTAIHAIFGRVAKLGDMRGGPHVTPFCAQTFVTAHPAAILRQTDDGAREAEHALWIEDLRQALSRGKHGA